MTLNEYIAVLQEIARAEDGSRGEYEVVQRDPYAPFGALRKSIKLPTIETIKVKTPREQYRKLATSIAEMTDEKVVLL